MKKITDEQIPRNYDLIAASGGQKDADIPKKKFDAMQRDDFNNLNLPPSNGESLKEKAAKEAAQKEAAVIAD